LLGIAIPALTYRLRMVRVSANPEMDAIFLPSSSPLVGYWGLFKPGAFDFAWLRAASGRVSVDWLVIGLTLAFVGMCALSLRAFSAKQSPSRDWEIASSRKMLLAMTAVAIALASFSLYRYREDARFAGGEGYRTLVQTVAHEERARDVLILNDDARAPFLFNAQRARLRWYGLSRDPKQFDDATRALLARLARQSARVWFAYDDVTAELPDPTRDWLDESLRPIAYYDFDDGAHLVLYETGAP
jgi:hypothetical protein